MAKDNLDGLEFPRLMHHVDGTKRRVEDVDDAEQALKDGYTVHPTLSKEQEAAVKKVMTPDQVKADAAVKEAQADMKDAETEAADARVKAEQVAAHTVPAPGGKKK